MHIQLITPLMTIFINFENLENYYRFQGKVVLQQEAFFKQN